MSGPKALLLSTGELAAWAPRLAAFGIDADVATELPTLTPGDYAAVVLDNATRATELLPECDAAGVRMLLWGATRETRRIAARLGLSEPFDPAAGVGALAEALGSTATPVASTDTSNGCTIVVWGPHGAPGRTTIAVNLAAELASQGQHTLLIDADSHAPAHAMLLNLPEHAPGFPAVCRRALGTDLDEAELARVSAELAVGTTTVTTLAGINRPSRWVELSYPRVRAALSQCTRLADVVVVDVSAALESDEELVSDEYVPARNAAAHAALAEADIVVAVASAEPLGIARFLRDFPEVKALSPGAEHHVVVNRVRGSALGVDPRGQVRRTLERYAGVSDISFVSFDAKGADAAILGSAPLLAVAPRAQLAQGVRALATRLLKAQRAA